MGYVEKIPRLKPELRHVLVPFYRDLLRAFQDHRTTSSAGRNCRTTHALLPNTGALKMGEFNVTSHSVTASRGFAETDDQTDRGRG